MPINQDNELSKCDKCGKSFDLEHDVLADECHECGYVICGNCSDHTSVYCDGCGSEFFSEE